MTDEQIKQNAEVYADKAAPITEQNKGIPLAIHTAAEVAYIAGAHSRDEEIEELKKEIESLQEQYNTCFDGFKKRGTKLGELMKENIKLRNPWISVEERMPEDRTKVLVQYIDGDREVVWYRDKKFVCVVPDQQKYTSRAMVLVEGVMVEKPIFSVPKREVVTDIVTHWMPIPETHLNK